MDVLVVGSGGREHALAWGLARSSAVDEVVIAPGNPGAAEIATCQPLDRALVEVTRFGLVVVGPEQPLAEGLADEIREQGVAVFGPGAAAAQLERSKAWMKEVVLDAGVPTARHATFDHAREDEALAFLETLGGLYVIKTDGLAAGKGVRVTELLTEAREAVREYLSGAAFGDAGRTVVLEEGLTGPELSLLALCDGSIDAVPLPPAQDFKQIGDGDTGPNTGGMGAYSPVPIAGPDVVDHIMDTFVSPTLAQLAKRDIDYRGVLYAGLMFTADGPKLIEYNIRFGDPECQVVVPRLESDLFTHCMEAATGRLTTRVRTRAEACVGVVLATEGYPASRRIGDRIEGLEAAGRLDGVTIFDAGTARAGPDRMTAGGRVLTVTALGATIAAARSRAYEAAACISWPGVQYRRDIAVAPTPELVPAEVEGEIL